MIVVELGDTGEVIEFPDDTPEWEIQRASRNTYADMGADKSPIPHDPGWTPNYNQSMDENYQWVAGENKTKEFDITGKARAKGFVTDKTAPVGLFESGFGLSEKDKAVAMENALEEHFGRHVPVKPTEYGLSWLDPETNRWTLATERGPDMGDLKEHAATIAQIGTEVASTVVATATIPGAGFAVGAMGGAFASEYARLLLGKYNYGTNKNMTQADMLKSALVNSGLAYVGGKIGEYALKLAKGTMNVINKRYIPEEAVDAAEIKADDIDEIIKSIQKETDKNATPTLDKQSGDQTLLRIGELERKNAKSTFNKEFNARDAENREAAKDFLDAQNRGFGEAPDSTYPVGKGIAKEADRRTQPKIDAAEQRLQGKLNQARELELSMPSADRIGSGKAVRSALQEASNKFEKEAETRYTRGVAEAAQQNGLNIDSVSIGLNKTSNLARELDADISDIEKIFPNLTVAERKVIGNADETAPLFSGEPLTFDQYRRATSFLKKRIRLAENGLGESTSDVSTMKRLLGTLVEDYEDALKNTGNDGFVAHMRELDKWYSKNRKTFDEDLIGELLGETKGGMSYVKDYDVFHSFFKPGNVEGAERVASVLVDAPGSEKAIDAVRREMLAEYRRQVYRDGRPIAANHERFMQEYKEVLRPFFSNSEWKKISGSKNLASAIDDIERKNELLKDRIKNTFDFKLAKEARGNDVTYGNLFGQLWNKGKVGEINKVKDLLSGRRELMNQFRALAAKDIRNQLFGRQGVKLDNFSRYMDTRGGEIKALFGNEYYRNLHILGKYLDITQREPRGVHTSGTANAFMDALKLGWRAYVGPLSHKGYVARKAGEFTENTQQRVLARLMLEPQMLDELIKASTLTNKQKAAAKVAGLIYMTSIDDEFIETPDLIEPAMESAVNLPGRVFTEDQATEMMQSIPQ